jgi:hypothetical protein
MDPFLISAGISSAGGLFKGITSYFSSMSEAAVDSNNAEQADREAGVNAQNALQSGNAAAAHGAVAAAANGGGFVGSSTGVIQNLSNQAMYNARQQIYRGQTVAQADNYAAKVAKFNAWAGLIGGGISAGSSLAGGFAQSALYTQQQQSIRTLKGLGADTPYDYAGF